VARRTRWNGYTPPDERWLRFPNFSVGTAVTHGKIMQYLKSMGYKLVVSGMAKRTAKPKM
jgi:hypothetical protein